MHQVYDITHLSYTCLSLSNNVFYSEHSPFTLYTVQFQLLLFFTYFYYKKHGTNYLPYTSNLLQVINKSQLLSFDKIRQKYRAKIHQTSALHNCQNIISPFLSAPLLFFMYVLLIFLPLFLTYLHFKC